MQLLTRLFKREGQTPRKRFGIRVMSVVLTLILCLGMIPLTAIEAEAAGNNTWTFASNYEAKLNAVTITATYFTKQANGTYALTTEPRRTASFVIAKYDNLESISFSNSNDPSDSPVTVAVDSLTQGVAVSTTKIPGFAVGATVTLNAPAIGSSDPGIITISVNSGYNLVNPGFPPYPSFANQMTSPVTITLTFSINVTVNQSENGTASAEKTTDDQWILTAEPDEDYKVSYWASRPMGSSDDYTKEPDSEGQTSFMVAPVEDTEYICYFNSAIIVPTEAILLDDSHILLTMNDALTGTEADPDAFTVTGVASSPEVIDAVVSGSSVTLTLSDPITATDASVAVAYDPTGTNDLSDGSGSPIDAFTVSISYMDVTFQSNVPGVTFAASDDAGAFTSTGATFSYHQLPPLCGLAGVLVTSIPDEYTLSGWSVTTDGVNINYTTDVDTFESDSNSGMALWTGPMVPSETVANWELDADSLPSNIGGALFTNTGAHIYIVKPVLITSSITAISADTSMGSVAAPVYSNGDNTFTLSAEPNDGYTVDYWASRPAGTSDSHVKVPGSDNQLTISVPADQSAEYICYFRSTEDLVLLAGDTAGMILAWDGLDYNHLPNQSKMGTYDYTLTPYSAEGVTKDKLAGNPYSIATGATTINAPTYVSNASAGATPPALTSTTKPVNAYDNVILSFNMLGFSRITAPVSVSVYPGDSTEGQPLYTAVQTPCYGSATNEYSINFTANGGAGTYATFQIPVDAMPLVSQVTVALTVDGMPTVVKTYALGAAVIDTGFSVERAAATSAVIAAYNDYMSTVFAPAHTEYSQEYLMCKWEYMQGLQAICGATSADQITALQAQTLQYMQDATNDIFHSGVEVGFLDAVVTVPWQVSVDTAMCAAMERLAPGEWYLRASYSGGFILGYYLTGGDGAVKATVTSETAFMTYGITGTNAPGFANGVLVQMIADGWVIRWNGQTNDVGTPPSLAWDLGRLRMVNTTNALTADSVYNEAVAAVGTSDATAAWTALRLKYLDSLLGKQTQATRDVVRQIADLTSASSPDDVSEARTAYDALSSTEKSGVFNYSVLTGLEHSQLQGDELAAYQIDLLIEAIGTVEYTQACLDKITAAREAYEAATPQVQALVTKLNVLNTAKSTYEGLAEAAVSDVETLIDALPAAESLAYPRDEAVVNAAKTAHDALLAAEKAAFDSGLYNKLQNCITEIENLKNAYIGSIQPDEALAGVLDYIQAAVANPAVGYTNGEWAVLALARGDVVDRDDAWAQTYLANLDAALTAGSIVTSKTDYERVTLALTSLGIDASAYGTSHTNLTAAFSTYEGEMALNAKIFALIALNSKPYESTVTGDYVDGILAAALEGGGWALMGDTADVDMTAMAIQALAPYYGTDTNVQSAVAAALDGLKEKQDAVSGGFGGSGNPSTCSTAQVVTALCALGMDPTGEEWTTTGGKSPVTGLLTHYNKDNGYFGESSETANQMATEQAAYTLVAYDRFSKEWNSLYDMSDAFATSSDTRVRSVTVNGAAATAGAGNTLTVVLPYGSDPAAVTAADVVVTTMSAKASSSVPETNDNGATWTFTVTAEDGSTADYTIQVSVSQDPAGENQAAVAAARAAIESLPWGVPMAAANTEPAVNSWVEARIAALDLNGVTVTVAMDSFTAATETTAGSFTFTADLAKGEGETLATGSIQITGIITVPPYAMGQVRVIVENTTYPESAGAPWEGVLADTWVEIDEESSMMSAVTAALSTVQATVVGAESGYISSINGLAQLAGGTGSGWMGTLNDWFTNTGFDNFTVVSGTLEAGDQIRVMYSTNLGDDLGGSWDNNDKTVQAITFSSGTLSPAFDKDTHAYTLTVPQGTEGVMVTPTATNKNFQVRAYLGSQDTGTEYRRTRTIPISDGALISVVCGDPSWPSMNNQSGGTGAGVPAETYTITVQVAEEPVTGYTVGLTTADSDKNPGDTVTVNLNVDGAAGSYAALQTVVGYDSSRVSYSSNSFGAAFTVTDNPAAGKLLIIRVGDTTSTGDQGSLSFTVKNDIQAGSSEAVFTVISALVGISGDPNDPEAAATADSVSVDVHNLAVTFAAGPHVALDTITAYARYGTPGLYTDNTYTTAFSEPAPTAESGYVLDSPPWNDGSANVDYAVIAATAFTANAAYTATAVQGSVNITLPAQVTVIQSPEVPDGKAIYGTDVVFSVTPGPGLEVESVSYTVGSGSPVTLTAAEGLYTIPGTELTADVTVTVTEKLSGTVSFISFDDYKGAPTGFKVLKFDGSAPAGYKYQYNGADMYYSEKYQLFVCFVATDVDAATALAGITCVEGTAPAVNYDGNVNQSPAGLVNIIDAQLVYDLYTAVYLTDPDFAAISQLMRFAADMDGNGCTDTSDVQIIVNLVQSQEV